MKAKKFVLLFCMLYAKQLLSQSLRYFPSQPFISLSAYSSIQNDPLSFTGNQAALVGVKSAGIGIFGERRFMLKEISVYTIGASVPTNLGNFAVMLNYGGFRNFNENKFGLAYALRLGKFIDAGVQFNYYGYRIPAYGSASAVNFEIGIMMHFSSRFTAGIHAYNPVGGKLGKDKAEKIASAYKLGFGYDASDKFFICSEVIKEEDKPVNVIAGLQYHFARQFFVKAGIISESAAIYAGAGLAWKNLRLDISSGYHPRLGFSPGLLLIINFKVRQQ